MARLQRRTQLMVLCLVLVCALIAPNYTPVRLALAAGPSNGPATLVKDIDTRPATLLWWGSAPGSMFSIGGTTYFSAQLDSTGFELWKTDGTASGTVIIKDIVPGPEDSQPFGFTNVNGTVFFSANGNSERRQLWKTDGSTAGTTLVKDLYPTASHLSISNLTNVNGTLFFLADNPLGSGKIDLWKSDGTAAGTTLVKQLNVTMSASPLLNINGTLFVIANDPATGTELWKTDGTAAGTVLVKDIAPDSASSNPAQLTNVNGTLFFAATGTGPSSRLWKSDGTAAGTVLVDPGGTLPPISEMINVNGTLFFSGFRSLEFGGTWSIWKSDGTAAGSTQLKDVDPGAASISPSYGFKNINGTLYFVGLDAINGRELWKSDGTEAGTLMVKDINPGSADSGPMGLTEVNGVVFFSATQNNDSELWKSDGTSAGTLRVKDINPGFASSNPVFLVNAQGTLLFDASDGVHGAELWKSDGTEAGTTMLKDIDPDAGGTFNNALIPPELTDVNGTLFFAAEADLSHRGLWKSDGTEAGTTLVKNFPSGQSTSTMPTNLTNVNGTLFFVADDGTTGRELWKSDGTEAGTTLVKDINPNPGDTAHISNLTNVNGRLYFSADDSVHGQELWKSDGTNTGTTLVKDINPGLGHSAPANIVVGNGAIYFGADDGTHGAELWKSDGSEVGTTLVKDIRPGAASGFTYNSSQLINANGTLFMIANDGTSGEELWRSDGTDAGTTLVKDINPGAASALPDFSSGRPLFTLLNGTLFFAANDGSHGRELWKSDGTAGGTALVKDSVPGVDLSYLDWFAVVNGKLLFSIESPIGTFALWKSDGTEAGTSLVKAAAPGDFKLMRGPIVPLGNTGKAIFSAYDDANGVELWQTDGTAAATQLLQNIAAGALPSNPEKFTLSGQRAFFLADDYGHGKELWSLPLAAIAPSGSAQITPAGGAATFGPIHLSFPPNAVATPITITYSGLVTPTHALGSAHGAGTSFLLEARDGSGNLVTHFAQPYTLVISYTDEQLAALGVDEAKLNLAFWNGSAWVNVLPCAGCGVDTANNRLTAVLDHFSEFALIDPGQSRVYLPLVVR